MIEVILVLTIVILIVGPFIVFLKILGTPRKNNAVCTKVMEEKVISIGGKIIDIELKKRDDYPYYDESFDDDGSYYSFYKIQYSLGSELKEGWGILKLQQSFVGPVGAADCNWIWRL